MIGKLVDSRDVLVVEPMLEYHALELLKKRLGEREDETTQKKLTIALDYMPLAMAQAAAYIKKRKPMCSIESYLVELEKSRAERSRLLSTEHDMEDFRRDRESKNSILLTWQISFEHIHRTQHSAAEPLSMMSFYDNQNIPQVLLQRGQKSCDTADCTECREKLWNASPGADLIADIIMLRDYTFISAAPDGESYEMHRLVQSAVQQWLEINDGYQVSA